MRIGDRSHPAFAHIKASGALAPCLTRCGKRAKQGFITVTASDGMEHCESCERIARKEL